MLSTTQLPQAMSEILKLSQQSTQRCHIYLPDVAKPVGAIQYQGRLYSYVKFFPKVDAAMRGANRMVEKGNKVVLTEVPKGVVLWVYEPDAQIAQKSDVY